MATRAAEAGLLASQLDVLRQTHPAEAIPFFERAVELEPELTSAYVSTLQDLQQSRRCVARKRVCEAGL